MPRTQPPPIHTLSTASGGTKCAEPAWLADVVADVATWPPLTPEQVGTVVRAFGGAPPGSTTTTHERRTTRAEAKDQPSKADLVRDAHRLLTNCGVTKSPSWVSKTASIYLRDVTDNGVPFGAYLLNRVCLSADQRRQAMNDPEMASILTYADTTGEGAVWRVMSGGDAR